MENPTKRRGKVFHCKNGCGYIFSCSTKHPDWKKHRDAFDYHEKQGCSMVPRLACPIGCQSSGVVKTFKGPKALKNHFKSKAHIEKASLTVLMDNIVPCKPGNTNQNVHFDKNKRKREITSSEEGKSSKKQIKADTD